MHDRRDALTLLWMAQFRAPNLIQKSFGELNGEHQWTQLQGGLIKSSSRHRRPCQTMKTNLKSSYGEQCHATAAECARDSQGMQECDSMDAVWASPIHWIVKTKKKLQLSALILLFYSFYSFSLINNRSYDPNWITKGAGMGYCL